MAKKEYTYIDLFAGCGGLSLGLHNAGWKGIFAVEKSPLAFQTLEHNLIKNKEHFGWPDWLDKRPYSIDTILKNYRKNLYDQRGKVDMVVGGPPCQGFSTAGKREESDKRNELIKSYIRFIRIVQPKLIFFENVRGFTQKFEKNKTKGKKYSDYVKDCLSRTQNDYIGYQVKGQLIDFSQFGIPQKRTRFILVGIRKDLCKNVPRKVDSFFSMIVQNKNSFLFNKGLPEHPTIEQAISDLVMSNGTIPCEENTNFKSGLYSEMKSEYQKYFRANYKAKQVADSHRFANHTKEIVCLFTNLLNKAERDIKIEGEEKEKFNLKKRGITVLGPGSPAPTLTSHPDDYVHYSEPRILTVREYARIQSFPDWYQIKGKYTTGGKLRKKEVPRYTQMGNSIPPLFGEQAGLTLKQILADVSD